MPGFTISSLLTSKSPFSRFEPKVAEVVIALSLGAILMFALVMGITRTRFNSQPYEPERYPIELLGQTLLGDYLIPFELASVLLLAVMIGAAYLSKSRRREEPVAGRTDSASSRQMRAWS